MERSGNKTYYVASERWLLQCKVWMLLNFISTNQYQQTVMVLLEYYNRENTLSVNISNFSIGLPLHTQQTNVS